MPRFRFVDRPAVEPEWKAVHRAADRGIPALRGPFLDAVEELRDGVSVSDMEVLIQQGGAAAVIGEIPWFEFEAVLTDGFLPAIKETQRRAMRGILGILEDDTPADRVVLTKQDVVARFDLTNPQSVQVAARQAAEAVQQVSASTKKAIREIVRRGQLGQLTVREQADRIRDLIGLTERQTASVLNFERKLIEQGVTGQRLERMVARKFDQVLKRRATTIARTECLLPETLVDAAVVRTIFRRWYTGPIVEIVTSNGRQLRTTPNHPMLTSRGWIAAAELNKTDDLICCLRNQHPGASRNPDVETAPATISQIFDSFSAVSILERHRARKPDFHGDGMEGEIDTLRPNGGLTIGRFAPLYEPVVNQFLSPTNEARPSFCLTCRRLLSINQQPCLCSGTQDPFVSQTAADRSIGDSQRFGDREDCFSVEISLHDLLGCQVALDIMGHAATLEERVACIAQGANHPSMVYDLIDPAIVSPHQLPYLSAAEAGEIQLDRVVAVRLRSWSGHVYNIATPYGYFTANGLYTGNTIKAANLGQQNLWRQAADQGLIDRDTAQRRWIATSDDRVCFPAGTMVATPHGPVPIEKLSVGDHVLSHAGPRRVVASTNSLSETIVVRTPHATIETTKSHPFWVVGSGWTEAYKLKRGDLLCVLKDTLDSSVSAQLCDIGVGNSKDYPPFLGKPFGLTFIPNCVTVPITAVSFNHDPAFGQKEINGIPSDSSLLNKVGPDVAEYVPDSFFKQRLGSGTPITRKTAELPVRVSRFSAESFAAAFAANPFWRSIAGLRTMDAASSVIAEHLPASRAITVGRFQATTPLRTMDIPILCVGGDGESLSARRADLVGLGCRVGSQVALPATISCGFNWTTKCFAAMDATPRLVDRSRFVVAVVRAIASAASVGFKRLLAMGAGLSYTHMSKLPNHCRTVYNIQVEAAETFFADGVLVHNCPICAPMDGQLRPLEEPFVSPFSGDQALVPGIHSSCRCAVALEVAA